MWAVCFILVVPVMIVGVIYVFMSNKPSSAQNTENALQVMHSIIKGVQTKQAFNAALEQFRGKHKVLNNEKELDVWISCVKDLANSTHWDTDAIAKFGQELEDANVAHSKKIAIAIATALKTKEQKK